MGSDGVRGRSALSWGVELAVGVRRGGFQQAPCPPAALRASCVTGESAVLLGGMGSASISFPQCGKEATKKVRA